MKQQFTQSQVDLRDMMVGSQLKNMYYTNANYTTFSYIMERTPGIGQVTGKLYHLRLRVECTFFAIYNAGRDLTPYWW
jgi:hypothetical protein